MFRIVDANKPCFHSLRYPTRVQAERDIAIASCYAIANNLPIPALSVEAY